MSFGKEYFGNRRYSARECVIKRHFSEVLDWASRSAGFDFFDGTGKKALAVGCGYGYEVEVLASLGYDACGVDISKYGVKRAKENFLLADFAVCDVQEGLPFGAESFDLLTCFGVLEHLTHPVRALENMFAVCKDAIICTSPNRFVEKPLKQITRDVDETHINVRSREEWQRAISEKLGNRFLKIDPFFDASFRVSGKLLFFRSFKIPYFGLDFRILIRR